MFLDRIFSSPGWLERNDTIQWYFTSGIIASYSLFTFFWLDDKIGSELLIVAKLKECLVKSFYNNY